MTQFRSGNAYLSPVVHKALRWIAEAKGGPSSNMTADALADEACKAWLQANHPDVLAKLTEMEEAKDKFRKELRNKLSPIPFADTAEQ